jgi:hypothetical protein
MIYLDYCLDSGALLLVEKFGLFVALFHAPDRATHVFT